MKAGDLTKRAALLEPSEDPDLDGKVVQGHVERGTVWANVLPLRGGESIMQARMQSRNPAIVTIRISGLSRRVTSEWRVRIDGRTYDVKEQPRQSKDRAMLEFMGRQARAEGWVVELFQIAKRLGPPPNRYILYKLKEKAADNQRDLRRISENIQAGLATDAERQWLAAWQADMAEIEAIQSARASTDRGAA